VEGGEVVQAIVVSKMGGPEELVLSEVVDSILFQWTGDGRLSVRIGVRSSPLPKPPTPIGRWRAEQQRAR
jgi:hypothetical protein